MGTFFQDFRTRLASPMESSKIYFRSPLAKLCVIHCILQTFWVAMRSRHVSVYCAATFTCNVQTTLQLDVQRIFFLFYTEQFYSLCFYRVNVLPRLLRHAQQWLQHNEFSQRTRKPHWLCVMTNVRNQRPLFHPAASVHCMK